MRAVLGLRRLWACAILAVGVSSAPSARADDQWLLPSTFVAPYGGDPVSLRLFAGEGWQIESERAVDPERILRFRVQGVTGRTDLAPQVRANERPLAQIADLREGLHVIALDLGPAFAELPAEKFEAYLRAEGLEAIVARRAALGESKHSGRERSQRSFKALLQVGQKRDDSAATIVGSDLELLPSSIEPRRLGLDVRFQGKPLPDLLVEILTRRGEDRARVEKASAKTDARGHVALPVPAAGTHLVRAVHMVRCDDQDDVEWSSYWSTLVYEAPPATEKPTALASPDGSADARDRIALSLALSFVALGSAAYFAVTAARR